MSNTDRQNRWLVAEDWKRIYQSFRNAEFLSYDFDNLRRTMITYLRRNYPEDFNDYIESSEYIALIDLIAFLGQNFSFRTDLNARENFLETAERRESVLRLARLLSYQPKRVVPVSGLLKIISVTTTEDVRDENGLNLTGVNITFNDNTDSGWNSKFTKILNAALPDGAGIGNPIQEENINGVLTQQYRLNSTNTGLSIIPFTRPINGVNTNFEVTSVGIENSNIIEEPPFLENKFSFLYRSDGKGNQSSNTGYFVHFTQGNLVNGDFELTEANSNQVVAIDDTDVNENDIWLYSLDSQDFENEQWSKVTSTEGNNVIYNNLEKNTKNIYSVLTRIEDRISLVFGDGTFGNIPLGKFRAYYRTSSPSVNSVDPTDISIVSLSIPYTSRSGKAETLNILCRLPFELNNGASSESNESIKTNAPQNYYTQNRMITAEDYQLAPLARNSDIIKVKSVNRVSSGISRYFDLLDSTGKYSKTNLYGSDGILTKNKVEFKSKFSWQTRSDIAGAIVNTIQPILSNYNLRNFYYSDFTKLQVSDFNNFWTSVTNKTNQNTGYFTDLGGQLQLIGDFTTSTLKYITPNTLLKFEAPDGKHFMKDNNNALMDGTANHVNSVDYIWTKVYSVQGNGTELTSTGAGSVKLTDIIPTGAKLAQIVPKFSNQLVSDTQNQIIDQVFARNTFGLRYDINTNNWYVITLDNLNLFDEFSLNQTGNTTSRQLDSSWLLLFEPSGNTYNITYRGTQYLFESPNEIRFYYDSSDKVFNRTSGKTIKDKISVLNINNKPDSTEAFTVNYDWEVIASYRDADGYVDSSKMEVSFFDSDEDGVVDDPDIFDVIVADTINTENKIIFRKRKQYADGSEQFLYFPNDNAEIVTFAEKSALQTTSTYDDGQIFYYVKEDYFELYNKENNNLSVIADYVAVSGRDKIKFQYIHSADQDKRLDPSVSNLIDVYVLTKGYDTEFRRYLRDAGEKPLPPSSDQLFLNYNKNLSSIKSVSDEIIYNPVKYKIIFGQKANNELQATFKLVKNPESVVNDNDIKSQCLTAINEFFELENWNFGDTFYFSELSAYVMKELSPNLVSFVVVPNNANTVFGSLFEVKAESDEIFISGAQITDLEIIDEITATKLQANGAITTSTTSVDVGIQSANLNVTSTSTSSSTSSTTSSSSSSSGGSYY